MSKEKRHRKKTPKEITTEPPKSTESGDDFETRCKYCGHYMPNTFIEKTYHMGHIHPEKVIQGLPAIGSMFKSFGDSIAKGMKK